MTDPEVGASSPSGAPSRVDPGFRLDPAYFRLPHQPSTFRDNLRLVLPLFFVGGACFVLSLFFFQTAGAVHPSRIPLWLLSLSIAVVATAGATTAVVFGDFSEPEEGFAESALRSGEYLLVPRSEWERRREPVPAPSTPASAPEMVWPTQEFAESERPKDPLPPGEAVVGLDDSTLWKESIFSASAVRRAGQMSRATDRLAEQVDELVKELDLDQMPPPPPSSPSKAARGRTTPERPSTERPQTPTELASGAAVNESARIEYEILLRELREDAERATRSPSKQQTLVCSRCSRSMGVDEAWEACTACWRTYCPTCLVRIHPADGPFVCPKCGHRKP